MLIWSISSSVFFFVVFYSFWHWTDNKVYGQWTMLHVVQHTTTYIPIALFIMNQAQISVQDSFSSLSLSAWHPPACLLLAKPSALDTCIRDIDHRPNKLLPECCHTNQLSCLDLFILPLVPTSQLEQQHQSHIIGSKGQPSMESGFCYLLMLSVCLSVCSTITPHAATS